MVDKHDSAPGRRPRAPTITVDTSAVHDQTRDLETRTSFSTGDPNSLAVPASRQRGDSIDSNTSQSTVGSLTFISSPSPTDHHGSEITQITDISLDDEDFWKEESGEHSVANRSGTGRSLHVENNPFGLTTTHLSKLIPRKDLTAFFALRGPAGLEIGLRTSISNGLSLDENELTGSVSYDEVKAASTESQSTPTPALNHSETRETAKTDTRRSSFSDRVRIFGDNRLPERKSKSIFRLAWIALQDKVLVLLSIAAVVSLALGLYQTFGQKQSVGSKVAWVEGVAIIIAIFIVVSVGALNDWQKERQFVKLNRKKEDRYVKVIRSGRTVKVSVHDVYVGDVMMLEQGDVIPTDGIYIDGYNVTCDESSATGESDLIKKTPSATVYKALEQQHDMRKMDPFILSGAKVSEGVGSFVVTATGVHSSYGKTMMALRDDNDVTPLQFKLNKLAGYIAKLGSGAGLVLFAVLLIEFLARLRKNHGTAQEKAQDFLTILITSITIIVVAVPEGLPLAVTLALAFATKRMTKDNNLVRHLQSCETMGNATVICSDKTGTLTQNVMTVVAGTFGLGSVRFGDKSKEPVTVETANNAGNVDDSPSSDTSESSKALNVPVPIHELSSILPRETQDVLKQLLATNSTAFEGEEDGKATFIGSKTETALLDWAQRYLGLETLSVEKANSRVVQLFPFDSAKKCMGVVVKLNKEKYRLYIKGAPEVILGRSNHSIKDATSSLEKTSMTDDGRKEIRHFISQYAQQSLRTIALAFRDFSRWPPEKVRHMPDNPQLAEFVDVFQNLCWLGVVGIQDPVRNGVPEAVKDCQRAGVSVLMVTGDNVETARAIAKECGILKDGGRVLEGPQFRNLDHGELLAVLPELCVLARSSPEDKRVLVKAFKERGAVVAVTGDGTNDAPALKAADVGFSMGIAGTEVAKEASDIILMDDNFSSIVKALAWGRTINDAVKKFLQFQITVNITAVVVTFVSAVSDPNETSVLNAVQLLWVNLIMDTFAALALATDPPSISLLDRKPESRNSSLITLTMWKMIIGQSLFQLAVTFVLFFAGPKFLHYPDKQQRTLVFNVFVWMQIFNAINSRRIDNSLNIFEGLGRNWFFIGIIFIMIAGQVLIVFVSGSAFVVTPLNGPQWAISIVIGLVSLPIGVLLRCIPDRWVRLCTHKAMPSWLKKKREAKAKILPEEDFRREWNRALVEIRDDLAFYKRIRGGRLSLLVHSFKNPRELLTRSRSGSRLSASPMHSAIGMPGLIAGSIGGLSPVDQRSIDLRSIDQRSIDQRSIHREDMSGDGEEKRREEV